MPIPVWKKRIRLHETTRRIACRFAFLSLAVFPVLLAIVYSAVQRSSQFQSFQKSVWEKRISENLGIDVRFESIEFPTPWHFRIGDLTCYHPENGKQILKVAMVKSTMDRSGWTVDLSATELNGSQTQTAIKIVHDWFLCRPKKTASLLALNIPQLSIHDGNTSTVFENIEIGIKPTESTSTMLVRFSMAGSRFGEPAALRIDRHHSEQSPSTICSLRTHDSVLPSRVIADRLGLFHHFGEESEFRGDIHCAGTETRWSTQLNGVIENVDLAVATSAIGSPMRGKVKLLLDDLHFQNERLIQAKGTVVQSSATQGTIDNRWLTETTGWLSLPCAMMPSISQVNIRAMQCAFELNERGLSVQGKLAPKDERWPRIALLVDDASIAGTCSKNASGNFETIKIPVTRVFSWLQSTSQSPATSVDSIAKILPWPMHRTASTTVTERSN